MLFPPDETVLHRVHDGGSLVSALHSRLGQTYLLPLQRGSDTFPTGLPTPLFALETIVEHGSA